MKIYLPEIDLTQHYSVEIGDRTRYATATAISFISDDLILAASYFEKKIYLIKIISSNEYTILNSATAGYYIDLMDYRNGMIAVSHLPYQKNTGSVSLFKLEDTKFRYIENIPLPSIKPHSCKFFDDSTLIISNMAERRTGCLLFNLATKKYSVLNKFSFYPKDSCIYESFLFIVSTEVLPSKTDHRPTKNSSISCFNKKTKKKIDELIFVGQTDGITFNGTDGFVSIQDQDTLLHFRLIGDKLQIIGTFPGFSFPHGLASTSTTLGVSNYGDNSIDIL